MKNVVYHMIQINKISNSKKGSESNPTAIVISVILGLVFLAFILIILLDKSKSIKETNAYTECQSLVINVKGVCKSTCDSNEMKYKGLGCPPENNKDAIYCCIDPQKVDTQSGNNDYRFTVFNIGLDPYQISNKICTDNGNYKYTCKNRNIRLKMSVTNTGKYALDIFANPKVGETYPTQGTAVNVKPGETKTLYVTVTLDAYKTYIIKGAAKCNTGICKEKFGNEGIFSINEDQYITITRT